MLLLIAACCCWLLVVADSFCLSQYCVVDLSLCLGAVPCCLFVVRCCVLLPVGVRRCSSSFVVVGCWSLRVGCCLFVARCCVFVSVVGCGLSSRVACRVLLLSVVVCRRLL